MKGVKWYIATIVALLLFIAGQQYVTSDFKSSFLVDGSRLSSLSYLSDNRSDSWRQQVRDTLKRQGDSHVDIFARNTDADWGVVNGVNTATWRARLQGLINEGLDPVIWMRSDDSPELDRLGINDQIVYNKQVIESVGDLASHYVIALEADEYYSVPEVRVLLQNMRRETDKPIGIHLTPGMRGKEAYAEGFDIIYLQTGFGLTEEQFRAEIEYALTLGKPVVVSEYHKDAASAEAARLGDIACTYGNVIGTGNGRGLGICGTLASEVVKEKWLRSYVSSASHRNN